MSDDAARALIPQAARQLVHTVGRLDARANVRAWFRKLFFTNATTLGGWRCGFRGKSSFAQGIKGPKIFLRDLVDDFQGTQVFGEDFPSVGFHFQMPALFRIAGKPVKCFANVIPRVFHPVSRGCVQGDVKMYPPFIPLLALARFDGIEGQIKVLVALDDLSILANHHLMEIDFFDESVQSLQVLRTWGDPEGGAQVELA